MRRIAIFGSTGSIGRQALEVVESLPEHLQVSVLAAGRSIDLLASQVQKFRPRYVVAGDERSYAAVKAALSGFDGEILAGAEGLASAAAIPDTDVVLSAITGFRGLPVSLAAVRAGKRLALANKESMVVAGPLLTELARASGAEIIPVDSEHSALYQALKSGRKAEVRELVLTGSGGPFRNRPLDTWQSITIAEALKHPTWSMGKKISIDSATMMNKALEIVEACHLFDVPATKVRVVLHPQSIVHSLVVFCDGSVVAQMGPPDMRTPIQYALTYPDRLANSTAQGFSASLYDGLQFADPDLERYPSLGLGYAAAERGGTLPAVLNAANERAVELFLAGELQFHEICPTVAAVMSRHHVESHPDLHHIHEADHWAREEVTQCSAE